MSSVEYKLTYYDNEEKCVPGNNYSIQLLKNTILVGCKEKL